VDRHVSKSVVKAVESELFEVGAVVDGKYRIEGVIGSGGMGVVFLARHLSLRERVAIKVLKRDRAGRPGLVERLLREARAAASIRNRHGVRVLDVGTLPDAQPFIVMEYLEGEDLATRLNRTGPLPVSDAVDYVLEACEAVAEAHALGIVHRDLKPANLFLERRASGAVSIKVLDFGVARFLAGHTDARSSESGLTSSHSFVGSPAYVSPEQLTMPDEVDTRADVWALGIILHEMLSGTQPFKAATLALTCTKILQEVVPPLARSDVAPEMAEALTRALEKDRERRFATVLELGAALAPYGSAGARASLAEIQAISENAPSVAGGAAPATFSEPGSPTLTGSVLRAHRAVTSPRGRRFVLISLAVSAAVAGVLFFGLRAVAPPGAGSSEPQAAPAASARVVSAVPEPASSSTQASAEATPPSVAPVSPSALPSAKAQLGLRKVTPAPSSAAAAPTSHDARAASPPPAEDQSERLYEFRK
jgi:eukaryotic-like serine/threonine-protein kinase